MYEVWGPQSQRQTAATSSGSISRLIADRSSSTSATTSSGAMPWAVAWAAIWPSTSGVRT